MALKRFKEQVVEGLSALTPVERAEALIFMQNCVAGLQSNEPENKPFLNLCTRDNIEPKENKITISKTSLATNEINRNSESKPTNRRQQRTRNDLRIKKEACEDVEIDKSVCNPVLVGEKDLDSNNCSNSLVVDDSVENVESIKDEQMCVLKCPACYKFYTIKRDFIAHLKSYENFGISCRKCHSVFSNIYRHWKHNSLGPCKLPKHKCVECGAKFIYKRHYLKHLTGHRDNNCKFCTKQFSTLISLKSHLELEHSKKKLEKDLIPCKFCSRSFSTHSVLYNHYRLKHSRGKFVCLSCGLFLSTKEKYKDHCEVHDSEKNWMCEMCGMKFFRKQQYLIHNKLHRDGVYKCLTCNVTLTSIHKASKHKSTGHKVAGLEPKFECKVCSRKFTRKFSLQQHKSLHSNTDLFKCEPCFKTFRTLDLLKKHEKTNKHLITAKVKLPESEFEKIYEDKLICESCGRQYASKKDFTRHLRLHKDSYKCNICLKIFNSKSNLRKHELIHLKTEKEFICETCGDSFQNLPLLKNHKLYKHDNVKLVKCSSCEKTFKRQSELNRHLKLHELTRSFVCYCGQTYKLNSHLKRHQERFHVKDLVNYNTETVSEILLEENGCQVYNKCPNDERNLLELQVLHPIPSADVLNNQQYETLDFQAHANNLSAIDMTVIQNHTVISIGEQDLSAYNKSSSNEENIQLVELSDRLSHDYATLLKETDKHMNTVIINQDDLYNKVTDVADSVSYLTPNGSHRVEYLIDETKQYSHEFTNNTTGYS